jgi:hypothetical protein
VIERVKNKTKWENRKHERSRSRLIFLKNGTRALGMRHPVIRGVRLALLFFFLLFPVFCRLLFNKGNQTWQVKGTTVVRLQGSSTSRFVWRGGKAPERLGVLEELRQDVL